MKKFLFVALFALPVLLLTSCLGDDNNAIPLQNIKTYQLGSVSDPSISGTAKFIENSNGSTTVELQLTGTPAGGQHPAHIHVSTAAEGGAIAVTLGTVDGDTGFSTITFSELDDTTAVTFAELLAFDGYINVHVSAADLGTLVAQGDIGKNELTGNTVTYPLAEVASSGISGNAIFAERASGETLVALSLTGTVTGQDHAAHIHDGSVATAPGAIAISLTTVNGESGKSLTSISVKDDETPITYSELIGFDGYINIHNNADVGIIDAQGDIGQNDIN